MHAKKIVFLCLMLASTHCLAEAENIRLPGIYSRWKNDNLPDKPGITMEELKQCMGNDNALLAEYQSYMDENAQLEAESLALEKLTKTPTPQRETLDKEAKRLNEQFSILDKQNQSLNSRKQALEALTSKKATDAAAAKKINLEIDQFNADVKALNAQASLQREQSARFSQQQADFNASLTPIRARIDAFNQNAERFKNRKNVFDQKLEAYREKCSGERQLLK